MPPLPNPSAGGAIVFLRTDSISLKSMWQEAIGSYPLIRSSYQEWDGDVNTGLLSNIKDRPSVLVVEETKAYVDFGVPEDAYSMTNHEESIEVVKFKYSNHSEFFKSAQLKSNSHFEKSESFGTIWSQRFHWLIAAENIPHICILDRFAMLNHLGWDSRQGISGLERFIRQTSNSARSKKIIKIFTSWGKENQKLNGRDELLRSFKESLESIIRYIPNNKINRIIVHILHDTDFQKIAHDRHIRFGNMHVLELGKGLSCLNGNTHCTEKLSATLKTGITIANEYKAKETSLEVNKGKGHIKVEISAK